MVVGDKGGNIFFLNGLNGIPIWNITVKGAITSPIIPYMIHGETYFTFGTTRGVYSIDKSGDLNWVYMVNHSVKQVTVGDVNNDNVFDIFFISYGGADSYIYALDGVSGDTIWSKKVNMSSMYEYFHIFMYFGDFDQDGTPNVLVVWDSGDTELIDLNAVTGEINWVSKFNCVLENGAIADMDRDGVYEFVSFFSQCLTFVNLADGGVKQFDVPDLEHSFSLVIGNFDTDPDLEIFTGIQIINNVGGVWDAEYLRTVDGHYLLRGYHFIYHCFATDSDGDGVIELFVVGEDYGLILVSVGFTKPIQYRVFWNGINGGVNGSKSLAYIDPDADGLATSEELVLGTSPYLSDSDSDGISDEWEVYFGLNPVKDDVSIDPDKDGLTNLQEFYHGTNPYLRDTDNDGLSDGLEAYILSDPKDPLTPIYILLPVIVFIITFTWAYRSGMIGILRDAIIIDKIRFKEYLKREKERRKREIERKAREKEGPESAIIKPVYV